MMGFGSSHVYKYDLSDEESLSETEFDRGLSLSESDSDDEDHAPPPTLRAGGGRGGRAGAPRSKTRSKKRSRASPLPGAARPAAPAGGGFAAGIRGGISRLFRRMSGASREENDGSTEEVMSNSSEQTQRTKRGGQKRWRRADTNVVSIKFESLIKPSHMHTGDAERCKNCDAILSQLSKLTDTEQEDEKIWNCEFCGHTNILDLMPEEVPTKDDITYMLQPAASTAHAGSSGLDESLVIFCVDISGSMCVTTEVPGRVNLRGNRLDQLQSLNTERENQFMPGQRRDVTYVSRLQGMQGAVDHQLEDMKKDHPNRRVALIAFNNEVVIYGDGSKDPVHIAEHRLNDKDDLTKMGSEALLPRAIKDSRTTLGDKVFDLEEGGATALGPAILFSVALACQVPGSKVIVCTDGKANVGLGSLDTQDLDTANKFYEEVSQMAIAKGVSVSVTSIKGTDCRMEELGSVANATGGQVNIVDPLKLTEEFGSILADPVIATNVTATFITHSGLYIRDTTAIKNKVVRYVGNVTLNSEVTFEFGIKDSTKRKMAEGAKDAKKRKPTETEVKDAEDKPEDMDTSEKKEEQAPMEGGAGSSDGGAAVGAGPSNKTDEDLLKNLSELPFQLQITYTDLEGAKALRVVTQSKPMTTERGVAEQYMNVEVLGVHAAQKTANLALDGMYEQARYNAHANNIMVKNFVSNNAHNKKARAAHKGIFKHIKGYEQQLLQQQQVETREYGMALDVAESSGRLETRRGSMDRSRAKAMRSHTRDDEMATTTYQLKGKKWSK